MKKFLLVAGFVLGSGAAEVVQAADLAPEAAPAPAFLQWSGFYAGDLTGYGWADSKNDTLLYRSTPPSVFVEHNTINSSGFLDGLEVGYNWMVGPGWLIGAEADAQVSDIEAAATDCLNGSCGRTKSYIDFIATLRGRIGYAWGNWMVYATGGGAFVQVDNYRTAVAPIGPFVWGDTGAWGWTAGGGAEFGLGQFPFLSQFGLDNWTAKVEYLFIDFNASHDYTFAGAPAFDRHSSGETQLDLVRVGFNYHFNAAPAPMPMK